MSTTITIPSELERRIAERAAAQGVGVEQFALEALDRATSIPSLRDLFEDVREQIQETAIPDKQLDAEIELAVNEVRKQRRA